MSLVVTNRPEIAIQSNTCKHSAIGNPIIYKFQREDYQSNSLTNSAGNLRIVLTGDLTSVIAVGASVYFRSDNAVYDGYYTVLTITYLAPDTTITFSGGYTAAGTTGFINLTTRLNYKAEIEVWDNINAVLMSTLRVSPDSRGVITVDVSTVLKNELSGQYIFEYTMNRDDQPERFKNFYIKYMPVWIGGSVSQVSDSANDFWGVFASRQIGSTYNGFMAEYVSFNTAGTRLPEFLTTFKRPKLFRHMPWTISAIFGDDIGVNQFFELFYYDLAGTQTANTFSTSFNLPGYVMNFNPFITQIIKPDDVEMALRTTRTGVTGLMSLLECDIVDPCDNPVMLNWVNSLGGDAWWCFQVNQEYGFTYDNGKKRKRFTLFADNLTLNEWEAINELNSPKERYERPFTELTSSIYGTDRVNGSSVFFHDYRDCEVDIFDSDGSPARIQFETTEAHNFPFDDSQIVYINADVYNGYFYAVPTAGFPNLFTIKSVDTGTFVLFTTKPTYNVCYKVNPIKEVVVIPTEQTTNTKQERHSISITIELPETFTV